jgi:hypothetical protein
MAGGTKRRPLNPSTDQAGFEWTADSDQNKDAYILYDELLKSRDRLAELPPLTPQDLESVARAMHELIFFLITPPAGAKTELALSDRAKQALLGAARNRELDLYVTVVALLARKLAARPREGWASVRLDQLRDTLDAMTFDYNAPKRDTLTMLREVRADLDGRIAYVRAYRKTGYQFSQRPETYGGRADRAERPDQFFRRIYGPHVPRGLTQADIRKVDPAFYNVLHVWCSRHKRKMSSLVPATRQRR